MSQFNPGSTAYYLDFTRKEIHKVEVMVTPRFGMGQVVVQLGEDLIDVSPFNLFMTMNAARNALANRMKLLK